MRAELKTVFFCEGETGGCVPQCPALSKRLSINANAKQNTTQKRQATDFSFCPRPCSMQLLEGFRHHVDASLKLLNAPNFPRSWFQRFQLSPSCSSLFTSNSVGSSGSPLSLHGPHCHQPPYSLTVHRTIHGTSTLKVRHLRALTVRLLFVTNGRH